MSFRRREETPKGYQEFPRNSCTPGSRVTRGAGGGPADTKPSASDVNSSHKFNEYLNKQKKRRHESKRRKAA